MQDSVSDKIPTEGQAKRFPAGEENPNGNRGSAFSRKTTCRSQSPKI